MILIPRPSGIGPSRRRGPGVDLQSLPVYNQVRASAQSMGHIGISAHQGNGGPPSGTLN